ncbi:MAG: hypothetical protein ABJC09_16800, partial [Terriglobia bacterium]
MPLKTVLCGPPHAGKSCLREGLKRAILSRDLAYPYPYCLPANPDGDGSYFFQASWDDSAEAANSYRELNKHDFSEAFILETAKAVENCSLPLVFVDIGGQPWPDNKQICKHATHAVILGKSEGDFQVWRQFCEDVKLQIIAEIDSDLNAPADAVGTIDAHNVLRGTVHHLERLESAEGRPMVQALADHVLRLTGSKPLGKPPDKTFLITAGRSNSRTRVLLTGFGRPASASEICRDARNALEEHLKDLEGIDVVLFDGPISVIAASALAWMASAVPVVGFFDPKLNQYVVVHSSGAADSWNPRPGGTLSALPSAPATPSPHKPEDLYLFRHAGIYEDGTRFDLRPTEIAAGASELVIAALSQFEQAPVDTPATVRVGFVSTG